MTNFKIDSKSINISVLNSHVFVSKWAPVSRPRPRNLDRSVILRWASAIEMRAASFAGHSRDRMNECTIAIPRMRPCIIIKYALCQPWQMAHCTHFIQNTIYTTPKVLFFLHLQNSERSFSNCQFWSRYCLLFCLQCHEDYSERIFSALVIHLLAINQLKFTFLGKINGLLTTVFHYLFDFYYIQLILLACNAYLMMTF